MLDIKTDLIQDQNSINKPRVLYYSYLFKTNTISSRSAYHLGMATGDMLAPIDYILHAIFPDYERVIPKLYSNQKRYAVSGIVGQVLGFILMAPAFLVGTLVGTAMYVVDRLIVESINALRQAFKNWLDFDQYYVKTFNATNPKNPMSEDQAFLLMNTCTMLCHGLVSLCAGFAHIMDKVFLPTQKGVLKSACISGGLFVSYFIGNAVGLLLSVPALPLMYVLDKASQLYEAFRDGLEKLAALVYVVNGAVDCSTSLPQDEYYQQNDIYNSSTNTYSKKSALAPIHSPSFSEAYSFFSTVDTHVFSDLVTNDLKQQATV